MKSEYQIQKCKANNRYVVKIYNPRFGWLDGPTCATRAEALAHIESRTARDADNAAWEKAIIDEEE